MHKLVLCTMLGLAIAGPAMADDTAAPADNPRLAAIYAADQAARGRDDLDWDAQREQDRAHRAEVLSLLRAGQLRTAPPTISAPASCSSTAKATTTTARRWPWRRFRQPWTRSATPRAG